ncbi:MAG: hypothetical protein HFJ22_00250 [Clostridia bacterium]|jgi:hypothetical protein|nr:hypothetical protein [Clostridia bacterium]
MDASTRALHMAEDNAERIRIMESALRRYVNNRTAARVAQGTAADGKTVFGAVAGGAAVVTFDGGACTLILDGAPVAFGTSPISAAFDTGGELALDGERQNARALVIGG